VATFGAASFTYDDNGNLTSDGVRSYTWNARDQLASLTGPVNGSFAYDGFGRRRSKTIGATTTQFLYDGVNPVQELSGGTPTANLLTGLGIDEFFTRTDAVGVRNYLTDALGSSVALADGSGTVQTEYSYDPFGSTTASGASSTNSFAFTGREGDGTGLYYYRARYYHPTAQRFIAEDTLGFGAGDTNLYGYTFNDPTNSTDPTGEIAPWVAACAIGAAGNAAADYMGGRKFSWKSAGAGCGMGLLGLGAAKAAGAAARAAAGMARRGGAGKPPWMPNRKLPADKHGNATPDTNLPHTQLGQETSEKTGEAYRKAREWGENGKKVRDIDFTDHGTPHHPGHTNPHQHEWVPNPTGGSPRRGRATPLW
jgi:RHS repeat-associated protein